jgi:pimeloyl-ACP methyl ester carboxylesterase
MPYLYRDEIKELDNLTRKEAGGSFIRLADGVTHYELSNPDARETVVLTHGFSVPYFIFDRTFAFLTQAGLRVLRYDLFGRGFSDRPDRRYNIDLFVRQLGDLLAALNLADPVSLVGLSTGGPITAAFTARFPKRVSKLVLIDPVGTKPFALGRVLKVAAAPGLGEGIIGLIGSVNMARRIAGGPFDREHIREFGSRYITQMEYRGFKRALLSSIRNDMLGSFLPVYQRIGELNKPVLLLWGTDDATVPFRHSERLRAVIPQAEFHAIERGGHIPHYKKAGEVNPILLDFLKR